MVPTAFEINPAEFFADQRVAMMDVTALGCYVKLMCFASLQGTIPSSVDKLARLCGAAEIDMARAWDLIEPCFEPSPAADGRLLHPAIEQERARRARNHEARAAAGTLGAKKRWGAARVDGAKHGDNQSPPQEPAKLLVTEQSTPAPPLPSPPPQKKKVRSQAQIGGDTNGDLFGPGPGSDDKGVDGRLPSCPQQEVVALYHEILPVCRPVLVWGAARQDTLRTRWREMAVNTNLDLGGGYRTKEEGLEWWRKFFVYCSKSLFLTGRAEPRRPGQAPFLASLDFILRHSTFIRTLEGGYHR